MRATLATIKRISPSSSFCASGIPFRLKAKKAVWQENVLLAAWKKIVSDQARNAPLLHLSYRDTRMVMSQNANGIGFSERFGGGSRCDKIKGETPARPLSPKESSLVFICSFSTPARLSPPFLSERD